MPSLREGEVTEEQQCKAVEWICTQLSGEFDARDRAQFLEMLGLEGVARQMRESSERAV
jgi:hypothetical protein